MFLNGTNQFLTLPLAIRFKGLFNKLFLSFEELIVFVEIIFCIKKKLPEIQYP